MADHSQEECAAPKQDMQMQGMTGRLREMEGRGKRDAITRLGSHLL